MNLALFTVLKHVAYTHRLVSQPSNATSIVPYNRNGSTWLWPVIKDLSEFQDQVYCLDGCTLL